MVVHQSAPSGAERRQPAPTLRCRPAPIGAGARLYLCKVSTNIKRSERFVAHYFENTIVQRMLARFASRETEMKRCVDWHAINYRGKLTEGDLEAIHSFLLSAIRNAVWSHDIPLLTYLLEANVGMTLDHATNYDFQMTKLVEFAVKHNMFAVAATLRKHGAMISSELRQRISYLLSNHPNSHNLPRSWFDYPKDVWRLIKDPPEQVVPPIRNNYNARKLGVVQSWPPKPLDWPESLNEFTDEATRHIIKRVISSYWQKISHLRREEALDRAQHNWHFVRRWYRLWCIASFWQGQTELSLCAPGGASRMADITSFENEFVF